MLILARTENELSKFSFALASQLPTGFGKAVVEKSTAVGVILLTDVNVLVKSVVVNVPRATTSADPPIFM